MKKVKRAFLAVVLAALLALPLIGWGGSAKGGTVLYAADVKPNIPGLSTDVITTCKGRIVLKNTDSLAVLRGKKKAGSPYYEDLRIEIRTTDFQLVATIVPGTNSGYSPSIKLFDFEGNGLEQIFYSASSGGSGGFGFFYVYSAKDGRPETVFDYERFGAVNQYSGEFLDGYRAKIVRKGNGLTYLIDLSQKDDVYKKIIYNDDGSLKRPESIDISGTNNVFPYYNYLTHKFQLLVFQRATGLSNSDSIGYIQSQLEYKNGGFETFFGGLEIFGA